MSFLRPGKAAQARQATQEQIAQLEEAARGGDRSAHQHLLWAKSHATEGRPGHAKNEVEIAGLFTEDADNARKSAAALRAEIKGDDE